MQPKLTASFENDGRGMVFIAQGVISGEQLLRQTAETYSREVLTRLRYQIVDLRAVERMDVTSEQMRELAKLDCEAAESVSDAKIAIAIVACHDLTIGISRIYSAYAQSPNLEAKIFPSVEEARRWIEERPSDSSQQASS